MALDRLPTLPSFDFVKDSIQLAHMWNCLISEADRDSCQSQAGRCQPHGRNYSFLKLLKGRTNNIVLGNRQESGQRLRITSYNSSDICISCVFSMTGDPLGVWQHMEVCVLFDIQKLLSRGGEMLSCEECCWFLRGVWFPA